jgi:hypothetical protein
VCVVIMVLSRAWIHRMTPCTSFVCHNGHAHIFCVTFTLVFFGASLGVAAQFPSTPCPNINAENAVNVPHLALRLPMQTHHLNVIATVVIVPLIRIATVLITPLIRHRFPVSGVWSGKFSLVPRLRIKARTKIDWIRAHNNCMGRLAGMTEPTLWC